ncbi:MAG TPA: polyprenyl synthetase family protein [Candidatus Acidoferrales bacterium]|nr:polyprenyl synthetase family protein [Candidatus Acidoferrales bacterium]
MAHESQAGATIDDVDVPPILVEHVPAIVANLKDAAPVDGTFTSKMIAYHMGWVDRNGRPSDLQPGKLIRPSLCLWACEACGVPAAQASAAATALELVHNFTLVHDDIQDGDRERRGRETVWAVWGLPQGINAGDALFSHAVATLTHSGAHPERQLRAARLIAHAVLVVVEGQSLDLRFEGKPDTTLRAYLRMVKAKTGVLIGASLEAGAVMAGADEAKSTRLADAGTMLGVAFQIRDDWLGTWGDPAITGKSSSGDLARCKLTFQVVAGYAAMRERERAQMRALFARPQASSDSLAEIRALLESVGGAELTRNAPQHYADRAAALVRRSGLSRRHVDQFIEVAQYVARRNR